MDVNKTIMIISKTGAIKHKMVLKSVPNDVISGIINQEECEFI